MSAVITSVPIPLGERVRVTPINLAPERFWSLTITGKSAACLNIEINNLYQPFQDAMSTRNYSERLK
jgi:hypothetical protein